MALSKEAREVQSWLAARARLQAATDSVELAREREFATPSPIGRERAERVTRSLEEARRRAEVAYSDHCERCAIALARAEGVDLDRLESGEDLTATLEASLRLLGGAA